MYKYSTAHTWTKLTGSNHKNNDARKEAADATSLYNWIFNSAVGGSTQNTCTLSAYVNSYLFTATNAIYSIWTDYNRTYGDFHNDVAGYFVHSLDQNAAPAGYSQVGSKGVRGHIDYVEVSGGDTPNLNVGADEIKLVVTY